MLLNIQFLKPQKTIDCGWNMWASNIFCSSHCKSKQNSKSDIHLRPHHRIS